MSKLHSSLNNILDHSISGLCDIAESAYETFGNSSVRLLSIDLKAGSCNPTGSQGLDKSVAKLIGEVKSIMAETSGHDLSFFQSIYLTLEFASPAAPIPGIWDGHVASYKATVSAEYPGGKYTHTKNRC